ncbi:hypothetical protein O7627_13605 [Solwaraspora sp. WMMD1047]|uniref:hypothetical protein n=1 Tax=Solwaraspora sp. WMMD1047 TaxID=3016102 RepID=UPI002416CCB7|nr:hypothetical protein [Solwaraspora sp. WMMD1047]MDG4830335.1 hypothetical protein [Solwaraspora sp. WMMD1047]
MSPTRAVDGQRRHRRAVGTVPTTAPTRVAATRSVLIRVGRIWPVLIRVGRIWPVLT